MTTARTTADRGARGEDAGAHPAPARDRASALAIWFGLLGAPAAWSIQTLVDLGTASHDCFPTLFPLAVPISGSLRPVVLIVAALSVAIAVAAGVVSLGTWRRTRHEHQEKSGEASDHHPGEALLETGEGRTRFMALSGIMTSSVFLLVSLVQATAVFLVTPCQ